MFVVVSTAACTTYNTSCVPADVPYSYEFYYSRHTSVVYPQRHRSGMFMSFLLAQGLRIELEAMGASAVLLRPYKPEDVTV